MTETSRRQRQERAEINRTVDEKQRSEIGDLLSDKVVNVEARHSTHRHMFLDRSKFEKGPPELLVLFAEDFRVLFGTLDQGKVEIRQAVSLSGRQFDGVDEPRWGSRNQRNTVSEALVKLRHAARQQKRRFKASNASPGRGCRRASLAAVPDQMGFDHG